MESGKIPDVKKIFVLRALVLGDLIFILPALEALHAAYPQAEIVYAARPWAGDFLHDRIPWINRVVSIRAAPVDYEDLGFIIHPDDAAWFFSQMRAERFDLAFSMQGGGKNSNPFIRRLGARVSIGSREQGAIALDRWTAHDYYQNDITRNLDLVGLAGAQPTGFTPRLPVLPGDLQAAEPFIGSLRRPYAVIHAGARDIRRMWPPDKFARLADSLKRDLNMEVVLTGSDVDANISARLENAMQEKAVNLSNRLSLASLVGVLANAGLVISNDTGVLHVALAVGTAAVGLYWSEYISKSLPLSRLNFQPVIAWERHCPLCGMFLNTFEVVRSDPRDCIHQVSFISSITHDEVMQAAQKVLLHRKEQAGSAPSAA